MHIVQGIVASRFTHIGCFCLLQELFSLTVIVGTPSRGDVHARRQLSYLSNRFFGCVPIFPTFQSGGLNALFSAARLFGVCLLELKFHSA